MIRSLPTNRRRRRSVAGRIGKILLVAVLFYIPVDLVFRNDRCHFHPFWGLDAPFAKKSPLRMAIPFEELVTTFQAPPPPASLAGFLRTHPHHNRVHLPHARNLDSTRVRKIGFRNETFWAGRFVNVKDSYIMANGERVEMSLPSSGSGWLDFSLWATDSLDSYYRVSLLRKKGEAWSVLWQTEGYTPDNRWFPFRVALDATASQYALEFRSDRPDGILCIGNPHVLQPSNAPKRPNVVIVVADALRRDALASAVGQESSPNLNTIARQSIVFENARSVSHWTRPSVASLMTSRLPTETGLSLDQFAIDAASKARFHSEIATLPHFLRQNGYNTASFTNDAFLLDFYSIGADIGLNECYDNQEYVLMDAKMTNQAVRWMNIHRDEPFMIYVHLDGPHGERVVPSQYLLRTLEPSKWVFSPELLYWSGVRYSDRYIGEIQKALEKMGLAQNTVLILLADHGCSRRPGSHQGTSLFDDEVQIPLVWKSVRQPGHRRIWEPVSIYDIFPSLCRELGLPIPQGLRGTDIVSAPPPQRPLFFQGRSSQGLLEGNWKYFRHRERDHLFDLAVDPRETNNLVAHNPHALRRMKTLLADSLGGRSIVYLTRKGPSSILVSPQANLDSVVVDSSTRRLDSLSSSPLSIHGNWSTAKFFLRPGYHRLRIRATSGPLYVGPYAIRAWGDSLALSDEADFMKILSTSAKRYPAPSGAAVCAGYEFLDNEPAKDAESFHGEVATILEDWGYIQKGQTNK